MLGSLASSSSLALEVIAQIIEFDVTVNHFKPFAKSSNRDTRNPRCRSGSVTGSCSRALLLAIFGDVFPCESVAVLALEGVSNSVIARRHHEQLAVSTSVIGVWRRNV